MRTQCDGDEGATHALLRAEVTRKNGAPVEKFSTGASTPVETTVKFEREFRLKFTLAIY